MIAGNVLGRSDDLTVVLAEREQLVAEFVKRGDVVGGERLALDERDNSSAWGDAVDPQSAFACCAAINASLAANGSATARAP